MKIIYIEADVNELKVRPTVMSAVESLVDNLAWALGTSDCEDDEEAEEEGDK